MNEEPRNRGMDWTPGDKQHLVGMFNKRASVAAMARELGRTTVSIKCKLQSMGLVDNHLRPIARPLPAHPGDVFYNTHLGRPYSDLVDKLSHPTQPQPYPKENTMPFNIKIENKTFVNGVDATLMSNEDFFALILKAENELLRLGNIEHQPKALRQAKDELVAEIMNLVSLLDARSCPAPK